MFVQAYINTAKEILKRYEGREPFASFLKKFFKENKKFGSRDRKQIAHLCYCFFRLGKSLEKNTVEEKLSIAIYLCDHTPGRLLEALNSEWNKTVGNSATEKMKFLKEHNGFSLVAIFPWKQHLSAVIEEDSFVQSFLIQPDIYLRLRPGKEMIVQQKLSKAEISFELETDQCIVVAPATKLDEVLLLNK